MTGKRVHIEIDWDSGNFHCPACGASLVRIGRRTRTVTPCPHLRYFLVGIADVFEWLAPDLDALRLEVLKGEAPGDAGPGEGEPLMRPSDWDPARCCSDSTVVFCFEEGGMACGPVSCTVEIAIDFKAKVKGPRVSAKAEGKGTKSRRNRR
jgi:hypothetical protein